MAPVGDDGPLARSPWVGVGMTARRALALHIRSLFLERFRHARSAAPRRLLPGAQPPAARDGEMVPHGRVQEALQEADGTRDQVFAATAVPDEKKANTLRSCTPSTRHSCPQSSARSRKAACRT